MDLNLQVEKLKDDLIKAVQENIRIKSVEEPGKPGMPFGDGVAQALNHALKLAESLGFATTNLDGYAGFAEFGEGDDYVAVLGHLDVVPEESGWTYPAYGGEIHDGKIFGRGAVDDKGPTIAALFALKAIKDLNLKLTKKVRIIFGTNEETGCEDMDYYMKQEKAPVFAFTPDADFPVIQGEKGTIKFNIIKETIDNNKMPFLKQLQAGQRVNIVPDYCKAIVTSEDTDAILEICKVFINDTGLNLEAARDGQDIILESFGKAAHGSTPELGQNAIMQMLQLLGRLNLANNDLQTFINFFNTYIAYETTGEKLGIGLMDDASGNLSLNIGKIEFKDKKIIVGCDVRFPVTFVLDDIINPLIDITQKFGMEIEVLESNKPLYYPAEHPLIERLHAVFVEQTGLKLEPKVIGGGTYAKYLPNTVAYGTIKPGKPHVEHQANEYIEIEDLITDAKIYAHAIYELAK